MKGTSGWNPLRYSQELREAGIPEKQAEAIANGQNDLLESAIGKQTVKEIMDNAIDKLRLELKAEITKGNNALLIKLFVLMSGIMALFKWL